MKGVDHSHCFVVQNLCFSVGPPSLTVDQELIDNFLAKEQQWQKVPSYPKPAGVLTHDSLSSLGNALPTWGF